MTVYVCAELETTRNIYGGFDCKTWVIQQTSPSVLDMLAITKADMVLIGGSIIGVFALFVAYAFVAKAVNLL